MDNDKSHVSLDNWGLKYFRVQLVDISADFLLLREVFMEFFYLFLVLPILGLNFIQLKLQFLDNIGIICCLNQGLARSPQVFWLYWLQILFY